MNLAFNMLSELPAIHAFENSREMSSSSSINSFSGSCKMISAHSNTSIASNESSTIATTSSDNISTLSTDNSDTYMSDSECRTLSSSADITTNHHITTDLQNNNNSVIGENSGISKTTKTGSLTPHELKHHSMWASNVEIQDKSLPEFPSTQNTRVKGETRLRGGKGEKGDERQSESNIRSMKDRICGLQTLHLAHNSFSGRYPYPQVYL